MAGRRCRNGPTIGRAIHCRGRSRTGRWRLGECPAKDCRSFRSSARAAGDESRGQEGSAGQEEKV